MKTIIDTFETKVTKTFLPFQEKVKRKAQGVLKYDYLVPNGVYEEQWDWDAFFMAMALTSQDKKNAIYLKNWVLNFIENAREDGYTPGCITPKGRDERLNQMKPFLAQGALFASKFLGDFRWIKPHYESLKTIVLYREKHMWNKTYDAGVWYDAMESGADNNVSALNFPHNTVIAVDLNVYAYREYKAMAKIAKKLGIAKDAQYFQQRASHLKMFISTALWDKKDGCYYNMDSRDGSLIRRVTFSSFHPLWANIAPVLHANLFIENYALNPKKMWSRYGIRTLAKDDKEYNNANILKPYSNWQGPVWPIANYFYLHALLNYGYVKEATIIAERIAKLCMNDIKKTGGMHENYDAETGQPLAAPNFISWNLLVPNMLPEIYSLRNPFAL